MINSSERRSLRDILWNYPDSLYRFYINSKPLGAIIISIIVAALLFFQLYQPTIFANLYIRNNSEWSEGVIGSIQVLNPIFVNQNQVDRDLYELIYEKLIYVDGNGVPQPGVAQSWEISEDGLVYTFNLEKGHRWHDGVELTSEDVLFTFEKARDLSESQSTDTIGSEISDVLINTPDLYTISFTLPERSSTFIESVSAYIIPKHILESVPNAEYNEYGLTVLPIGSGPYRIVSIKDGLVRLEAVRNSIYNPKISQINYYTFDSTKSLQLAFKNGLLDGFSGIQGKDMSFLDEYKSFQRYSELLDNRKKLIYLNIANAKLVDPEIRKALALSIDKNKLLENAVIDGEPTSSPIASRSWAFNPEVDFYSYDQSKIESLLAETDYKKGEDGFFVDGDGNPLQYTFTYLDTVQNSAIAQSLREDWNRAGFKIILNPTDYNKLVNEILATRNYELMLFEIETTIDPDQYNLWHSLKKNYPDLNISGYEYNRIDLILERSRIASDQEVRKEDYFLFQRYLNQDVPAIFLYEPVYNYVATNRLTNLNIDGLSYPHERFRGIENWEIK